MAAVLRKPVPGRPGFQRRGNAAGSGLGAREKEQVELRPRQEPSRRRQERRQASRGPCGRKRNGNSPGGTRPARPNQSQVKSLAIRSGKTRDSESQGCQRNLSSRRRRSASPPSAARTRRSSQGGNGREAEQPRQAGIELVPQPPPSGDASRGEQARHGSAAVSEPRSDVGSSDRSSTRSVTSEERTTPSDGVARSPIGKEL